MGADQKGVFQHGGRGIDDGGRQRKHIERDNCPRDGGDNDQRQQQRPDDSSGACGRGAQMIDNVTVQRQKNTDRENDEPQNGGLSEVFAKGTEKPPRQMTVLPLRQLQRYGIECRRGRAQCDHGKGAERPKQIQIAAAAQAQHHLAECAVVGKYLHPQPLLSQKSIASGWANVKCAPQICAIAHIWGVYNSL